MEEWAGHLIVDRRQREKMEHEAWHNIQPYPSNLLILVKAWPPSPKVFTTSQNSTMSWGTSI